MMTIGLSIHPSALGSGKDATTTFITADGSLDASWTPWKMDSTFASSWISTTTASVGGWVRELLFWQFMGERARFLNLFYKSVRWRELLNLYSQSWIIRISHLEHDTAITLFDSLCSFTVIRDHKKVSYNSESIYSQNHYLFPKIAFICYRRLVS